MNNFIIILNSLDTTSWIGTDIYNAAYSINLSTLFDYNFNFNKNYKVTLDFRGSRSNLLVGNVIGVYLSPLQNQQNILGLVNTKFLGSTGEAVTSVGDNPPVYLKGLNNTSTLTVNIRVLIRQTANLRTMGVTDLIHWYKFLIADNSGGSIYNYVSLTANGVLTNATISQDNILDLTAAGSYMTMPNIDFTPFPTSPLTLSFWFKTTTTDNFSPVSYQGNSVFVMNIIPSNGNRLFFYYAGGNPIFFINNNVYKFNNGKWFNIVLVFGNVSTHKLYVNGILVQTGSNSNSLTGVKTNFRLGVNQSLINNLLGNMSDFRFYSRELTANEIYDYYYNNTLSENPDYIMKLNFEESFN